jgi:hypothetical protein
MKNVLTAAAAALLLAAPLTLVSPASADNPATKAGQPTSSRTPEKQVTTPESQVDTTKSGETSDRTPSKHSEGAASGEKGMGLSGEATNQAWDQTYQSDIAQEKQLKSGGKTR